MNGFGLAVALLLANCSLLVLSLAWGLERMRQDREAFQRRVLSSEDHGIVKQVMGGDSLDVLPGQPESDDGAILRQHLIDPKDVVIGRRIGAGSFGAVFEGTYLTQCCVVKMILKMTEEFAVTFRAEILLTANLHHPNIVLFIGCCWRKELVCLVLEHVSRGALEDFLTETSSLVWADPLFKLAMDTARGMAYLHGREYWDELKGQSLRGIVHRDLKPDNVLVTEFISAKVSDFGTSRAKESNSEVTMTFVGTPLFCAPEVARGENYDERVDVYSFGLVLLAMAVRMPLLDFMMTRWNGGQKRAGNASRMLLDVQTEGWRPLSKDDDLECIPSSLRALIARCYAHDPAARPSFEEIIFEMNGSLKAEIDGSTTFKRLSEQGAIEKKRILLSDKAEFEMSDVFHSDTSTSGNGLDNPIRRECDTRV